MNNDAIGRNEVIGRNDAVAPNEALCKGIDNHVYEKLAMEAFSSPPAKLIGTGIPERGQAQVVEPLDLEKIAPVPLPQIELYDSKAHERMTVPEAKEMLGKAFPSEDEWKKVAGKDGVLNYDELRKGLYNPRRHVPNRHLSEEQRAAIKELSNDGRLVFNMLPIDYKSIRD